jgi:hypothetical protein
MASCPAHEDAKPSLSVKEGEDGRALLHCFAGCETSQIIAALGLKMQDLFLSSTASSRNGRKKTGDKPAAVWEIKNPAGEPQAVHARFDRDDGKDCLWRLPGAPPGRWGLEGRKLAMLPLYGSERAKGWPEDLPLVVVCEGEKAADALLEAGFCALGTVTGANGTPGQEALEVLRGGWCCGRTTTSRGASTCGAYLERWKGWPPTCACSNGPERQTRATPRITQR